MGGVKEMVIGMAHRGRLNVLVNTLGKAPHRACSPSSKASTTGPRMPRLGRREVPHGLLSSDVQDTPGGPVHSRWPSTPRTWKSSTRWSRARCARARSRRGDETRDSVVPVLIHGDAAFAGQGVVMELLQMSQARGFCTGGTCTW
jgi:2-oxoglutarate dehydrogenase E1 component